MKPLHIILLATIVILTSCTDQKVNMNTTINEDGTCSRELWFRTNSASLLNPAEAEGTYIQGILDNDVWSKQCELKSSDRISPYPMPQALYDSLNAEIEQVKARQVQSDTLTNKDLRSIADTVQIHAHRNFSTVQEMASALPICLNGQPVKSTAQLTKQFRWFYTYYTYTESFESIAPQFAIPLSTYMSDEAAEYWLTGKPDIFKGNSGMEMKEYQDEMEQKFYRFINVNLVNDALDLLAAGYDSIGNVPLSREEFMAKKQSIIDKADELTGSPIDFDHNKFLTEQLGSDVYVKALEGSALYTQWEQRQSFYLAMLMLDVDYQLTMPGGIIEINDCSDGLFRDGELHYRLTGLRLLSQSYSIQATSKGKNDWAFVLTYLLILAAIGLSLYFSPLGRRFRNSEVTSANYR